MSKFKIQLLTPLLSPNDNDVFTDAFLQSDITDFDSQNLFNEKENFIKGSVSYNFSHTYDEELSLHQNSQKELKFKMNRKILISQGWIENPYARNIHIGSMIALLDKNNTYMFFIVKDIDYTVKENNIIYSVSCQDFFSYQLARQSQNYCIKNDEKTDIFLGAFDVNYWSKKIVDDCNIIYKYVSTNDYLFIDTTGEVRVQSVLPTNNTVQKIIKDKYADNDAYKGFNRTFAFKVDNVSASQALIRLSDEVGMNLVAKEFVDKSSNSTIFKRFFWFEPKKKENNYSGLTFSPYEDIQDFSFNHKGNSLTTVLDVKPTKTPSGKLITLIPPVTGFWKDYFLDAKLWNENIKFVDNYFKNIVREKVLTWSSETFEANVSGMYDLKFTIDFPKNYSFFSFGDLYNSPSFFNIGLTKHRPRNYKWRLVKVNEGGEIDDTEVIEEGSNISKYQGKSITFQLQEKRKQDQEQVETFQNVLSVDSFEMHFFFTRVPSREDLDFAIVADQLPWLENKIIDCSYFLTQNICSKYEYAQLDNLLKNDLRVLNGKILAQSDTYFKAKESTMKAITDILINMDAFGGVVQHSLIDPISNFGSPNIDMLTAQKEFVDTYSSLFAISGAKKAIVDYTQTMSEYLNKYLNSQQGFLKNMYAFKEYFNKKVANSGYVRKFAYTISPKKSSNDGCNIFFQSDNLLTKFKDLEEDRKNIFRVKTGDQKFSKPLCDFFVLEDNQFKKAGIVTDDDYQDLYVRKKVGDGMPDDFYKVVNDAEFDKKMQYAYVDVDKDENGVKTGTYTYTFLTRDDFLRYYITKKGLLLHKEKWDIYDPSKLNIPTESLDDVKKILQAVATDEELSTGSVEEIIKSYLPLTSVFTTTKHYAYKLNTEDNSWIRTNADGETAEDYREYLENKYFKKLTNIKTVQKPWEYEEYKEYKVANCMNQGDYYKRVNQTEKGWETVFDTTVGVSAVATGIGCIIGGIIGSAVPGPGTIAGMAAGTAIAGFFIGGGIASHTAWSGDNWGKGGKCEWNFYKEKDDNIIKGSGFQWKTSELVYATSPNDYKTFIKSGKEHKSAAELGITKCIDNKYGVWQGKEFKEGDSKIPRSSETLVKSFNGYSLYKQQNIINITSNTSQDDINGFWYDNWKVLTASSLKSDAYRYKTEKYKIIARSDSMGPHSVSVEEGEKYFAIVIENELKKYFGAKDESNNVLDAVYNYWQIASLKPLTPGKDETNIIIPDIMKNDSTKTMIIYKLIDYEEEEPTSNFSLNQKFYKKEKRGPENLYKAKIVRPEFKVKPEFEVKQVYAFDGDNIYVKYSKVSDNAQYETVNGGGTKISIDTDPTKLKFFKKTEDGFYERVYCIEEEAEVLYVPDGGVYIEEDFSNNKNLNDAQWNPDGTQEPQKTILTLSFRKGLEEQAVLNHECNFYLINKEVQTETGSKTVPSWEADLELKVNSNEYKATIIRTLISEENVSDMSNGDFWFRYYSVADKPKLFQIAASIEVQLSSYWNQAYTYSKFCEYFIPKYWQPVGENGKVNFFANGVLKLEKIEGEVKCSLWDSFIPDIVRTDLLDTQYLRYEDTNTKAEESSNIKPITSINNIAINQAINEVGLNAAYVSGENIAGRQDVFYIAKNGGKKWNELVRIYNLNPLNYQYFSGQYVTILRLLKNNYQNWSLEEYDKLLKDKGQLWARIYTSYGNLILENKYENQSIQTGEQLLEAAKLFFKDYMNPEKQYNITIIDSGQLKGYQGQELNIGDPIEVNADEFYDEYDDVKRTLQEKLFISDIVYSLRKDNDIKLTVNPLKYTDKIMNKLVNLIR